MLPPDDLAWLRDNAHWTGVYVAPDGIPAVDYAHMTRRLEECLPILPPGDSARPDFERAIRLGNALKALHRPA